MGTCKAAGTAPVSFSSALLEGKDLNPEEEFDLKWSAASLYSGLFCPLSMRHNSDIVLV